MGLTSRWGKCFNHVDLGHFAFTLYTSFQYFLFGLFFCLVSFLVILFCFIIGHFLLAELFFRLIVGENQSAIKVQLQT